jgi:hypothetical protein
MKLTRECITAAVEARFWAKVDRQEGPSRPGDLGPCWPWTGANNGVGYGNVRVGYLKELSHRLSWLISHGDPRNLWVLHRCDNPRCCNPDHLFLGTHEENVADCIAKGRWPDRRGGRTGRAKLTEPDVMEILRLSESVPQRELASLLGVSRRSIRSIINGDRWQWLTSRVRVGRPPAPAARSARSRPSSPRRSPARGLACPG